MFKPDKKLKWLPHLGTVQLELELEDRTIEVDVPPLEAAFIELFSEQSMSLMLNDVHAKCLSLLTETWTLDELVNAVGSVDKSAAIKALSTWIDHGVLKEDPENTFNLLERAEERGEVVTRERNLLPVGLCFHIFASFSCLSLNHLRTRTTCTVCGSTTAS